MLPQIVPHVVPQIDTNFFRTFPAQVRVEVHTDAGNDTDDIMALILFLKAMSEGKSEGRSLSRVITTLYKPKQKAEIVAKIFQELKYPQIPIHVGFGCSPNNEKEFLDAYPFWPLPFGIPGFSNKLSLGQGNGYKDLSVDCAQIDSSHTSEVCGTSDVILGLAPLTDLAEAIQRRKNINRIVIMGGYLGDVSRPGYNTAVDPDASEKILGQKEIPVLIFNSQHIMDWKFFLTQPEVQSILTSTEKTKLGEAVAKDIGHYWTQKKPPYGNLFMSDVVAFVAGVLRPDLIKTTSGVEFKFNAKWYENPETGKKEAIHMLHKEAKNLLTVTKKADSNVHIVTELTLDPEQLRTEVVYELALHLFFKTKDSFDASLKAHKERVWTNDQIPIIVARL